MGCDHPDVIQLWVAELRGRIISGAGSSAGTITVVDGHGASSVEGLEVDASSVLFADIIDAMCHVVLIWFGFNPSGGHAGLAEFNRSFGALNAGGSSPLVYAAVAPRRQNDQTELKLERDVLSLDACRSESESEGVGSTAAGQISRSAYCLIRSQSPPTGVVGSDRRKVWLVNSLAAIRSLGRAGVRVIALDSTQDALGFRSRYSKAMLCPDPVNTEDDSWGSCLD